MPTEGPGTEQTLSPCELLPPPPPSHLAPQLHPTVHSVMQMVFSVIKVIIMSKGLKDQLKLRIFYLSVFHLLCLTSVDEMFLCSGARTRKLCQANQILQREEE